MRQFASLLRHEYLGNPVSAYFLAAATFLATVWAFLVARRLILRRLPGLAGELLGQIRAAECAAVALSFAARPLEMPTRLDKFLHMIVVMVVSYRTASLISAGAAFAIRRTIHTTEQDQAQRATAGTAVLAAKGVVWVGAVLFVLSNLGFNVTSMLAGLGIGGIAVALAAQAILGDLFSAVAIYLDKPFLVGDAIKVGEFFGTVSHIGIKTTRLRSLSGEMLVFPNSVLTSSRIQNFRDLLARRGLFTFSVPQGTPVETLRKLPEQVRAILEKTPQTRFERAHLCALRESGLEFEVVFHVLDPDYGVYMDRSQQVLLSLLEAMRADGIPLAQPTRVMIDAQGPAVKG